MLHEAVLLGDLLMLGKDDTEEMDSQLQSASRIEIKLCATSIRYEDDLKDERQGTNDISLTCALLVLCYTAFLTHYHY